MTLKIDKRYLKVPVSAHAQVKKLYFRDETGKLFFDLDVKLDPVGAEFTYYADMRCFAEQTLDVFSEPETAYIPELTDCVPEVSGKAFRPVAHFTPQRGWINDPNGLVRYEGKYHMFFQHNPVGMNWGNMHWGHAVSDDLIHWEEKEIALFPDELGTMYSGSAIIDEGNVSGLKRGDHAPFLLFYTTAGDRSERSKGKEHVQCLAFSTDGGETFEKYAGNPIIPHMVGGNRDPKVIFCPEMNAYVMALYLDGHDYALFRSVNLIQWMKIQTIEFPGDDECPDFYPLWLDDEKFWVLSGAHDCYLIGKIKDDLFVPVQGVSRLGTSGRTAYAAQTFSGLPDGRRVRISWNTFNLPGMPFNGSMTTPSEMFLRHMDGRVALCISPVPEVERLHGRYTEGNGRVLLPGTANDIRVAVPAGSGTLRITLFGLSMEIDSSTGAVRAGGYDMQTRAEDGRLFLRLIQDVHATEIFTADGAGYMCIGHLADRSMNYVDAPENVRVEAYELKDYRR